LAANTEHEVLVQRIDQRRLARGIERLVEDQAAWASRRTASGPAGSVTRPRRMASSGVGYRRRVLVGSPGIWDEMWTSHVNVVADLGGGFHMFYFGSTPRDDRDGIEMQRGAIGHAVNEDGVRWERNPRNPILAPRPGQADAWTVGGPSAIVQEGRIRLWFFGTRLGADIRDPARGSRVQPMIRRRPC
jgi:hypothetical protein